MGDIHPNNFYMALDFSLVVGKILPSNFDVRIMPSPSSNPPFEVSEAVKMLGDNIRVARIRRELTQEQLAQKCGIARKTLYAIERGSPGIALGTAYSVLWTLGLLACAKELADPNKDEHGKILEAARQKQRVRSPAPQDNDF